METAATNDIMSTQNNADQNNLSLEDLFRENDITVNNDEVLWDKLIRQIIKGNVIPVIGADMLVDGPVNLHDFVIAKIAKNCNLTSHPKSFSELIYDPDYKKEHESNQIYYQVNTFLRNFPNVCSKRLARLLSIRQFPFVITTSFTPVVERAMRSVWKDELRVMRFSNDPSKNQDIIDSADMSKPTLYYMFGKVGDREHEYVLTDTDMLNFVSSWLSDVEKKRPKNLCNQLKDKYLLMLGNNYSDWLFRFIWFSLRKQKDQVKTLAYDEGSMLAYDQLDDDLINFLERTKTFTKQNTSDVIDQIVTRLEPKLQEYEDTKFDKPEENTDVFISYSRRDSKIAECIYNKLTEQGKRVWYDKNNISAGGKFMDEIMEAIRTAKFFIPIFTQNITLEKNDPHVYRTEWHEATNMAISLGRTYIIPIQEEGFDFYNASIPKELRQHNAITIPKDGNIDLVVEKIIHEMNK